MLSVEVPDAPTIAGEGKPRRHPLIAGTGPDGFISTYEDGVGTLYKSFLRTTHLYRNPIIINSLFLWLSR